jgi:hypothetical protein
MNLNEIAKKVHDNAVAHGWWEPEFEAGDILLVSNILIMYGYPELARRVVESMEETRTFGDIMSLVHAELSEALEEHRDHHKPNEIYYSCNDGGCHCEKQEPSWKCDDSNDGAEYRVNGKPEGIPIEIADAIIRLLDYCGKEKIDIEQAVRIKMLYNEGRPYKHGGKKI